MLFYYLHQKASSCCCCCRSCDPGTLCSASPLHTGRTECVQQHPTDPKSPLSPSSSPISVFSCRPEAQVLCGPSLGETEEQLLLLVLCYQICSWTNKKVLLLLIFSNILGMCRNASTFTWILDTQTQVLTDVSHLPRINS